MSPQISPKTELEQRILGTYHQIQEYERIMRETADPRERTRAERHRDQLREFIQADLKNYGTLCTTLNLIIAEEIAQIAALYPDEAQRDVLLSPDVREVVVPFIIIAMTDQEAEDLLSERVFETPDVTPRDRERFHQLQEKLLEHGLGDLARFYGATRDEWQPPIAHQTTICSIIEDIIQQINNQTNANTPTIQARFFSSDFLSDDNEVRRSVWDWLHHLRSVIVIDAVSLFHPLLRQKLIASRFDADERVSLVVISPVGSNSISMNQLLEEEFIHRMDRAFYRFGVRLDTQCAFDIFHERTLKRWFFSILPDTVKQELKPDESRKAQMSNQFGRPTNIASKIFSRRTR